MFLMRYAANMLIDDLLVLAVRLICRCSKLFYMIGKYYSHNENTLSGADVSFVFNHMDRYNPFRFFRCLGAKIFEGRKHLHPDNALSM